MRNICRRCTLWGRKISQCKLAEQMGISYKVLNDILNGRRAMTIPIAMMRRCIRCVR